MSFGSENLAPLKSILVKEVLVNLLNMLVCIVSTVLQADCTECSFATRHTTCQGIATFIVMERHMASWAFEIDLLCQVIENLPCLFIQITCRGPGRECSEEQ